MSFLLIASDSRGQNIRYSGVSCALGLSKSIRYSGDFVIAGFVIAGFVIAGFVIAGFVIMGFVIAGFVTAGFVIAGFVSPYFTVILPGFQMLFVITGSSL